MVKKGVVLLALLLLTFPLVLAAEENIGETGTAETNIGAVVTTVGGTETAVSVETPSELNVKVETPAGVRLLNLTRSDGEISLDLSVSLPTPCHTLELKKQLYEETNEYVKYKIYLYLEPGREPCVQVIGEKNVSVTLEAPSGVQVYVEVEREIWHPWMEREHNYPEMEERNYEWGEVHTGEIEVENEADVEYNFVVEGNTATLTIYGCYTYELQAMRCPNCYRILLEEEGNCEETVIELKVNPEFGGKIVLLSKRLPALPEWAPRCVEIARKVAAYDPEIAKIVELRCREGFGWERALEIACERMEHRVPPEIYKKVCEELPERIEDVHEVVRERIKRLAVVRENVREEIKRLREEIRRLREKISKLELRVKELKRKLMITAKGVIDYETGEELVGEELPEVEVEVEYEGKPIVVKKEENRIVMEVNKPEVKVEVEVEAPLLVDENSIEVNGRKIRVTPDEIIERIRQRFRNAIMERAKLKVEKNKPVYEVKSRFRGRLLFLIPVEVPVDIEIDAESGKELEYRRPWWAFLVFPG